MRTTEFLKGLAMASALALTGGCAAVVVGGAAAGASAAHDRRGFGSVVSDRNIQITASEAIGGDRELVAASNIKVVVYNGVLLLAGQVPTEAMKARAEHHVTGYRGVTRVVNELVVALTEGFWDRRRDNTLTARVKAGLLDLTSLPGFDPMRVNVTTSGRIVYLMGLVSHREADAVADIARHTNGVDKVVKVFDYTD